jgi:hypothetical protein
VRGAGKYCEDWWLRAPAQTGRRRRTTFITASGCILAIISKDTYGSFVLNVRSLSVLVFVTTEIDVT